MTKDENSTKLVSKEKSVRSRTVAKKDKVKPPTKIIIRHLPPTMSEEEFLKQIDPLPEHDFYYFASADWSLGYDATCRAYITLKNYDDVFLFRDRFDGYVFVDSKGAEYAAIVEFAPFQGLLKNKSRRNDLKANTIEEEPHYQQFLLKLEKDREAAAKGAEGKLDFSLDRKKEEKITSTPLLQYLANKKEKRREEQRKRTEDKRRQREDDKERRRGQQQQQQMQQPHQLAKRQDEVTRGTGSSATNSQLKRDDASGGENVSIKSENTRSKRRTERSQRRREAYLQRKSEREKERQGEKTAAEQQDKLADTTDANKLNKDGKRFGDRRDRVERDRPRNRERNRDKEKAKTKQASNENGKKNDDANTALNALANNENINENVKNFIFSVVSTQDNVAKETASSSSVGGNKTQADKLVIAAQETRNKQRREEENATGDATNKQLQKQHSTEEQRRIRNKDRPSLAIYQPKARLRLSEESDGNSVKDVRSNPTSDSENINKQKDEPQQQRITKKVSRYSERRNERLAQRDKNRQTDEGASGEGRHRNEFRKSKSCEENSSKESIHRNSANFD